MIKGIWIGICNDKFYIYGDMDGMDWYEYMCVWIRIDEDVNDMNVKKKRLGVEMMEFDKETGMPLWRDWYGVGHVEWELWLGRMEERCGGNWYRCRKMLGRRNGIGKSCRYVGPKLRKRYNSRHKCYWSYEYLCDVVMEMNNKGIPLTNTALAEKLNVNVRVMMNRLKKHGVKLNIGMDKPVNLYKAPVPISLFGMSRL